MAKREKSVTEVTRAAAEKEQREINKLMANNPGMEAIAIWMTNNDDLVCPICAERNKQPRGSNWTENPPAHEGCRCWLGWDFKQKKENEEVNKLIMDLIMEMKKEDENK